MRPDLQGCFAVSLLTQDLLCSQENAWVAMQAPASALPSVTLVLPVKGLRDCSIQAWASHLSQQYGVAICSIMALCFVEFHRMSDLSSIDCNQ